MQVRIKKLNENAVIPSYSKDGDDVVHFAAWTEVERVDETEK